MYRMFIFLIKILEIGGLGAGQHAIVLIFRNEDVIEEELEVSKKKLLEL